MRLLPLLRSSFSFFTYVNYLTHRDRSWDYFGERGRIDRPFEKCRIKFSLGGGNSTTKYIQIYNDFHLFRCLNIFAGISRRRNRDNCDSPYTLL